MANGRKIFATITVVDGKPVVDLRDARYEVVETRDGETCIVERKSQEYFPMSD